MEDNIGPIETVYQKNSNETVVLENNPDPRVSDIENTMRESLLNKNDKNQCNMYYFFAAFIMVLFLTTLVLIVLYFTK
jgi:hypothetical protein